MWRQSGKQAIKTIDGWIVKFVDWLDNGVGIIHSDEPLGSEQKLHFSRKYGMILPTLEARYRLPDIQAILDPAAKAYIEHQLKLGKERLQVA